MNFHQIFHTLIAVYLFFGWTLFPHIHAPACAAVLVHWFVNKNRCVFSDSYEDNNGFTTELLQKVGIDISQSKRLQDIIPYILLIIPFAISIYLAIQGYSFGPAILQTAITYILSAIPFFLSAKEISKAFTDSADASANSADTTSTDTAVTEVADGTIEATADAPQATADAAAAADAAPPLK
jgi:hypothetical protein